MHSKVIRTHAWLFVMAVLQSSVPPGFIISVNDKVKISCLCGGVYLDNHLFSTVWDYIIDILNYMKLTLILLSLLYLDICFVENNFPNLFVVWLC